MGTRAAARSEDVEPCVFFSRPHGGSKGDEPTADTADDLMREGESCEEVRPMLWALGSWTQRALAS